MLYRTFPRSPEAGAREEGGPLHVARALQSQGRHDHPDAYGAIYASRSPVSAVAELVKRYIGQVLTARDLAWAPGRPYALVAIDDSRLLDMVDLDDPEELAGRGWRPSSVATHDRRVTRRQALALYEAGATGLEWWSTLEGSWINVTLFEDRALPALRVEGEPELLTLGHPALIEAAEAIGVSV
jgi:hypothetical protein